MPKLRNNNICRLLGCELPIVLAGMGGVARSELVAAVTRAGGFGFLGMVREPPELIEREVLALRQKGHERFGVNIIPAATQPDLLERQVETCLRLAVPAVTLFWDIDTAVISRFKQAGVVIAYQVGSVDEAIAAERAGVDIIIAQGREAGGHVRGTMRLRELLPGIVEAVKLPVLAAGGLASGADLLVSFALGAEGIVLGTALMATTEAFAHDYHKQRLLGAQASDTVLTNTFHINWPPGAPVRVIKSEVTSSAPGKVLTGERIVIGEEEGRPIYLYSTDSPLRSMSGDFAAMALYAGTGVGQIDAITSAGDRIAQIMADAENMLAQGISEQVVQVSSPVCYAGEMSGAYMGHLDEDEIAFALARLAGLLRKALHCVLARLPNGQQSGEPPFGGGADAYARWLLMLGDLSTGLNRETGEANAADQSLFQIQSEILTQSGKLLSGLPDGELRNKLSRLREFFEAERVGSLPV